MIGLKAQTVNPFDHLTKYLEWYSREKLCTQMIWSIWDKKQALEMQTIQQFGAVVLLNL